MLGDALLDPHGVDGEARGLGLLPLTTRFELHKRLSVAALRFARLRGDWSALSGVQAEGYEIRHGRTEPTAGAELAPVLFNAEGEAIGWQRGPVLGIYAHGLFESPAVMRALFGAAARPLDTVLDGLADFIDIHFEQGTLARLLEPASSS
jgi:adenosylcobyric acid synthase